MFKKAFYVKQRSLVLFLAIVSIFLSGVISPAAAADTSERIARLAMSTASMWMVESHEHAIIDRLSKGEVERSMQEADELAAWMKGAHWIKELSPLAKETVEVLKNISAKLKVGNVYGAKKPIEDMQNKIDQLHHELMEIIASGK